MESFSIRLRKALHEQMLSQAELSKRTGIRTSSISDYVKGKYRPKQDKIYLIARALNVSFEWLLGLAPSENINFTVTKETLPHKYLRPIVGTTEGGAPKVLTDPCLEKQPISECDDFDLYFFMIARGDSMSPLINDGDLVLVRSQEDVNNGELAVIGFNNGKTSTLKKFYKHEDGSITLKALNEAVYLEKSFSRKECEAEDIYIIGRVVEIRRTL